MARESIITIYRSIDPTIPTGLTFGEFGFAGANRQLFIGGTGGGATVQSIWIGASITGDDISTSDGWAGGTGAYRVSTTDAVKRYVDAIAGTKGEVASINGDTGIITITGAGNDAAVSVRSTVAGTHLIDVRVASHTLTGVASFDRRHFAIGASGHVSLTGTYQVTGDTVVAGNSISVIRSNNQVTVANMGVTGITSGTSSYGNTGTNGIFLSGTTGNISIQNTGVRSLSVQGSTLTPAWYQLGPQIRGDGYNINVVGSYDDVGAGTGPFLRIGSNGLYSLNGLTSGSSVNGPFFTITGDNGAIRAVNDSNTASIIFVPRIASASLTGVASFDPRHFALGASGHVSLTGSIGADSVRIASLTVTGAASFDTRHFAVGASGHVSLTGTYQVTGDTIVQTAATSSQYINRLGNIVNLDNKIATINGQTGVASFSSNFQITNVGRVDLADDITIAGNLTVQGTVVTANVSNFTVEDTLIKLGTGNNTYSAPATNKDLGFYMQYPQASNNIRLAGFFLDTEDTKFKLFTGLTAGAQDGLTGTDVAARLNTDREGYTMATLIARLDGGTF